MDVVSKIAKEKWTKYIYMAMLTIIFLFKPPFKSTIDNASLTIHISIFFIATLMHLLSQKDKNWFRLDVLFILGFGIVHFQWVIMMSFSNINPLYMLLGFADAQYINYGTWLSTVGIVAWFIGYAWFPSKKKNTVKYQVKYKKLLWLSMVLFGMFLLLAGSNFLSGGIYKGEGGSTVGAGVSVYLQILFQISILLLTAVVIINNQDKYKTKAVSWIAGLDKKYLLLTGTYILLFLSIGDRGAGMQVTFTFLVLFGAVVRPISFKEFSGIIIAGAIMLTLIGLGRSSTSGENILVAGANKVEFESNYDITIELANSSRTLYAGLSNVPEYHDYFLGKLWSGKFLAVIPLAQNVYLQLTDKKSYELGSAGYLTYLAYGLNPFSGTGTSLIADIYLNFGLTGVMFFMFILGLFLKKLQNELNVRKNFYWIVVAAIFASGAFYMGRGNLFGGLRPMVWGLILTILFIGRKKITQ